MDRLPTCVHNHILQMFPCHPIQGCNGVEAALEVRFRMPANKVAHMTPIHLCSARDWILWQVNYTKSLSGLLTCVTLLHFAQLAC